MYVYKDVLGESTRKATNICQLAQHGFIYKLICDGIYVYLWAHVYICKEVLSASTRKSTDICEFAQHGFTYKSIFDMIYVYLWVYACIQRGSKCEHSQGHRHMWVRTTRSHIQPGGWETARVFWLFASRRVTITCNLQYKMLFRTLWITEFWLKKVDAKSIDFWQIQVNIMCIRRGCSDFFKHSSSAQRSISVEAVFDSKLPIWHL